MTPARDDWPLGIKLLWQALAIGVLLLRGGEFVHSLRDTEIGVDFLQEWASVQNWLKERPLYAPLPATVPLDVPELAGRKDLVFPITYNAHPPTAVLLALPVAAPLGYFDAVLAWNLLSLLMLGAAFGLILDGLKLRLSPWLWLPALAALLLYNPFRQQMAQGQLNAFLLLCLTLTWRAERRGQSRWAGFWIGLAAAVKLFPALFFLYFLLRGRWRALLAATATCLACLTLTAAVFGPEAFLDYATVVVPEVNAFRASKLNSSLPGVVVKLFEGSVKEQTAPLLASPLAKQLALGLGGGVILLALFVATRRAPAATPETEREQDRLFSLWLVAMLLLSPITWDHSLLLATLPLALLWKETKDRLVGRASLVLLLLVFSANLNAMWIEAVKDKRLPTPLGPLEHLTCCAAYFYGLAALFMWLLLLPPRPPAGTAPPSSG